MVLSLCLWCVAIEIRREINLISLVFLSYFCHIPAWPIVCVLFVFFSTFVCSAPKFLSAFVILKKKQFLSQSKSVSFCLWNSVLVVGFRVSADAAVGYITSAGVFYGLSYTQFFSFSSFVCPSNTATLFSHSFVLCLGFGLCCVCFRMITILIKLRIFPKVIKK